jgi:hypothetical protein
LTQKTAIVRPKRDHNIAKYFPQKILKIARNSDNNIDPSSEYNWGSVSTETQNTQQSFEVSTTAPPGTTVLIEQVRGRVRIIKMESWRSSKFERSPT